MNSNKIDIKNCIETTLSQSKLNHFGAINLEDEPMWETPLIGFSKGDDPYYAFFKKDIGDFYWLPNEAFALGYKGAQVAEKDLTVISIAFPQTQKTKSIHKTGVDRPTLRWEVSRGEWEGFITDYCKTLVVTFEKMGLPAVAIDLISEFSRDTSEKYGIASNWSHRHTAFVSGLGTFGLSDGLITEKGKAMRFTTLIIKDKQRIEGDQRPYEKHTDWCKFYVDDSCSACMRRCPVGAITEKGHDKEACSRFLIQIKEELVQKGKLNPNYISSCGLCQCGVPCQNRRPVVI